MDFKKLSTNEYLRALTMRTISASKIITEIFETKLNVFNTGVVDFEYDMYGVSVWFKQHVT